MLPEALSNGWCSLRPNEDRGCLFVEMRIDAAGRKTAHRFGRGLMRSAARLTYEQVQAAHDAGDATRPARCAAALCRLPRAAGRPRRRAARSTSICRNARWCSTTPAASPRSRPARGSTATG